MMTISEKVAYLKGLAEGMELDTEKSKEGKLISVMIGILEEVGMSIEEIEDTVDGLGEEIDLLSDNLSEVESLVLHNHESNEGCECGSGNDFFEIECPTCEGTVVIDEEAIATGEVICLGCDSRFSLDLSDDEEEVEMED
ncbi:MAG: hypothetical protein R3Y07_04065 [Eubacteriales bacterium]